MSSNIRYNNARTWFRRATMTTYTQTTTRSNRDPREGTTRRLVVCHSDGQFDTSVDPEDISEIISHKDKFVWLDIQDPQEHDIVLLRDEFHFHPLAIED